MNSFSSSQTIDVLFATQKHPTHDDFWLIQGDASYFCFACAIENLVESKTLVVRKKKIMTHLLTVLLQNAKIWKVLNNKQDIVLHVLRLFFNALTSIKDKEYANLLTECCILIVKRSNPENATSLFNIIINTSGFSSNFFFIELLHHLIQLTPDCVDKLFINNAKYFREIISSLKKGNSEVSWTVILQIISRSTYEQCTEIPRATLKEFIVIIVEQLNSATSDQTIVNIVDCVTHIAQCKYMSISLQSHECSKFTNAQQSVVEAVKKLLLSTSDSVQVCAIKCVSGLCKNNSKIANVIMEKGINEFLLEILASSSTDVLLQSFITLKDMLELDGYSAMGHLLFGYPAVISSIKQCVDHSNVFYNGLLLMFTMLKLSTYELQSLLKPQVDNIIDILTKSFNLSELKFKHLSVLCLASLGKAPSFYSIEVLDKSFSLLESMLVYLESCSNEEIEFVCDIYSCVKQFAIEMRATKSNEHSVLIETLFYYIDKYCISEAVSKFITDFNFQVEFFEMLFTVLELDVEKGELLAQKLAGASFMQCVYEFKVMAKRSSRSSKRIEEVTAKLLLYLCLAVEKQHLSDDLKDMYYACLLMFNMPFSDWKFLLSSQSMQRKDIEYVNEARTCVLNLLAYSHLAGHCFTTVAILNPYLHQLSMSKSVLDSLPLLAKRSLLYLWCHVATDNEIAHQNMIQLCISLQNESCGFIHCLPFLVWLIKSETEPISQTTVVEYISNHNSDSKFKQFALRMKEDDIRLTFLKLLLKIAALCKEKSVVENCVALLFDTSQLMNESECKQLVSSIRMLLLVNEHQLSTNNITALFHCLNLLESCDKLSSVNEEEHKLYLRGIKLAAENLAPSLQVQLLNFINTILSKTSDTRLASLVLSNDAILNEICDSVFTNNDVWKFAKKNHVGEQHSSISILILTNLITSVHNNPCTHIKNKVRIAKDLFIDGLAYNNLPLVQISLLTFWREYLNMKCNSELLRVVNSTSTNEHNVSVDVKNVRVLCICFQNLMHHSESIVRNLVVDCFETLAMKLDNTSVLNNTWSELVTQCVLEKLKNDTIDSCSLRYLTVQTQIARSVSNETVKGLLSICFRIKELSSHILHHLLQSIDSIVPCIDISMLIALKNNVREIEQPKAAKACARYVVYSGMVLSQRVEDVVDVLLCAQITKKKLERQINILQGDVSTDDDIDDGSRI